MIEESQPRNDVRVTFEDGRVFSAPIDTPLALITERAFPDPRDPVLGAVVDGRLRELASPVHRDLDDVHPVHMSSSYGIRIYARSLSLLLVVCAKKLFPEADIRIEYSIPYGGYFCRARGRILSSSDLDRLRSRMIDLVANDLPIRRVRYSKAEAIERFTEENETGKVRLLTSRQRDHLHFHELDGHSEYFFGIMTPTTGVLRTFALEPFSDGFVLRFPRREELTKLQPPRGFSALREVFDEYGEWLARLGIRSVGALNEAIADGRIEQIILIAEALHEKRIASIAHRVAREHDRGSRLVLIAGPSASGKTTFSKRLAVQLLAEGLQPYPLAMDDYFHPRDVLSAMQGDRLDFDSIEALDVDRLRIDLQHLVEGRPVVLPHYDFRTGRREDGATAALGERDILLLEGIHALNPALFPDGSEGEESYRIFVSALTQLNLDIHNRVSTTDTRLVRRIVRDALYRGYTAEQTISMWENVRSGEKRNIFPYQEEAHVMFNSALGYELALLKPRVEPLLHRALRSPFRVEAERLLSLLWWFDAYETSAVPSNSILREFIGGSILRDYTPEPLGGAIPSSGTPQSTKEEEA